MTCFPVGRSIVVSESLKEYLQTLYSGVLDFSNTTVRNTYTVLHEEDEDNYDDDEDDFENENENITRISRTQEDYDNSPALEVEIIFTIHYPDERSRQVSHWCLPTDIYTSEKKTSGFKKFQESLE